MNIPFNILVKRSSLLKYGLLGLAAGVGLTIWGFASDQSMPERAALQKVEGEITKATQITTRRKRGGESVRYEILVKGDAPEPIKLSIPQKEISEAQVRSILSAKVAAEFDAENDVYVLSANGRSIMTYENSVKVRQASNRDMEMMGMSLAGLSGVVALIGFGWTRRKLGKEIAEWEAQQQQTAKTA
jgi:hypothetical protein